jgi:hypothetical protein
VARRGGFDVEISAEVGPDFYIGSQSNFGPDANPCFYYTAADTDRPGLARDPSRASRTSRSKRVPIPARPGAR